MPKEEDDKDLDDELDPDELDDDEDDDDEDEDEPKSKKVVKVTQDRMTQIMTREKKKGVKVGKRAILKELGFDNLESAKAALTKSETKTGDDPDGKNDGKIKEHEEKAAKAEKDAAIAKAEGRLTRRLTIAGVLPKKLDAAIKILDPEEHLDSDDDDVDASIEELQEKMPEFFPSDDEDDDDDGDKPKKKSTKRPARKSTVGGAPRKKGELATEDRVKDRLQRRHGQKLAKQ